jgi:hypothetical protein
MIIYGGPGTFKDNRPAGSAAAVVTERVPQVQAREHEGPLRVAGDAGSRGDLALPEHYVSSLIHLYN